MVATTSVHHHRSTNKHGHKPFKSRFSSKGSQKAKSKGKLDQPTQEKGIRRTAAQMIQNKLTRRNQARQRQLLKHAEQMKHQKIFDGRKGASRMVAVIPLCADVNGAEVVRHLNKSLDNEDDVPEFGICRIGVDRFKQKIQYLLPKRSYWSILDACKYADFLIFVLSANQEVDELGESFLRGIEGQGVSNVMTVAQNLNTVEPAKRRPDVKKSLLSYINHFFPTEEKIHAVDNIQEAQNVVRSLCTQHPKGIIWRDTRSYLLADELTWDDSTSMMVFTGVVRGKGLKADRLVHIQGYGDYQIDKICSMENAVSNEMDTSGALETPTDKQDSLEQTAPEIDADMASSIAPVKRKGVLLDDHHYFDDDEVDVEHLTAPGKKRRLPPGTSEMQAKWIVDSDTDFSDEEGDDDAQMNEEMDVDDDVDGSIAAASKADEDMEPSEWGDSKSEMFMDLSHEEEAKQIEEFRQRNKEAQSDLEFPDEIELPPNVKARERLHRYRGLKNLRTSPWITEEDAQFQPTFWDILTRIENYKATRAKTFSDALVGGVAPGTCVRVFIRNGPVELLKRYDQSNGTEIIGLFSLLRHERKRAVVNCSITQSSEYEGTAIKSKDELILQCGARRWKVKPLFSQGGATKNNVHKYENFLQPARMSVASFVGDVGFGHIPLLWYKEQPDGSVALVGTGTFLNVDHDRIIAKRKILTGHPYKIHKKLVTVRYMFFNSEDVIWFKALPLYTKRGRSGFIKESLGTHGYFKATFDGKINPQDAVCVNLYKRCFPLEAQSYNGR